MSIVALKRKSFTQFGKGHVDNKGVFSLNGNTCEPFQTVIHPSVKNQSGRLDRLYLGIRPVAKRTDKDISSFFNNQRVVQRHVVNPLQVCPPFFKDVGPMPYRDYVIMTSTPCITANP